MRVAFRDFPTWYGKASATLQVDSAGRMASIQVSGLAPGTAITIRLPQHEVCTRLGDQPLALQINLG